MSSGKGFVVKDFAWIQKAQTPAYFVIAYRTDSQTGEFEKLKGLLIPLS